MIHLQLAGHYKTFYFRDPGPLGTSHRRQGGRTIRAWIRDRVQHHTASDAVCPQPLPGVVRIRSHPAHVPLLVVRGTLADGQQSRKYVGVGCPA